MNIDEVTDWLNLTFKLVSQTEPVKANILSPEEPDVPAEPEEPEEPEVPEDPDEPEVPEVP